MTIFNQETFKYSNGTPIVSAIRAIVGPERVLNEILERAQTTPVQEGDLKTLVEVWESSKRESK